MIRLKPFDRIGYQNLREEYLKRLVTSHAIAFDQSDILLESERIEATLGRSSKRTTENTYNALDKRKVIKENY